MKEMTLNQHSIEKKLLVNIYQLIHTQAPLDDLKEHVSLDEDRRAIRIYINNPVTMKLNRAINRKKCFRGKCINVSESGILVEFDFEPPVWDILKPDIDNLELSYKLDRPATVKKDLISGTIKRYVTENCRADGFRMVQLGFQSTSDRIDDKINLLQYINSLLVDAVYKDIKYIKAVMEKRELIPEEQKIFDFLKQNYSNE